MYRYRYRYGSGRGNNTILKTKQDAHSFLLKLWAGAALFAMFVPFFGLIGIPLAIIFTLYTLAVYPLLPPFRSLPSLRSGSSHR